MSEGPHGAFVAPPRPVRWSRRMLYGAVVAVASLLALELALRVTGFRHEPVRLEVKVKGQLQPRMLEADDAAMWTPLAGQGGFNEDGFLGPRIPQARQAGVPRIAVVGDSCTHWGDPPYAEPLRLLLERRWNKPVEVLNAGVTGYSTHQGKRRLIERVLPYRPDVVTLYFGWNDHWLWRRQSDSEYGRPVRGFRLSDLGPLRHSRVVQGAALLAELVQPSTWGSGPVNVLRVPLPEYEANLKAMIRAIREAGAAPMLVTAPTDMTPTTPVSEFALLRDLESTGYRSPWELHEAYVAATRRVAERERVRLVDAYAAFAGQSGLLMRDHIHLTPAGIAKLAELLADSITNVVDQEGS